jgi:hypothetical protein
LKEKDAILKDRGDKLEEANKDITKLKVELAEFKQQLKSVIDLK